jgi:DNA-binding winged helix-turn-helix (wHTH) protein/TolB-like protein/Flp pilus assembly protein TadD
MDIPYAPTYIFDAFRLEPGRQRLTNRLGTLVPLPSRAYAVLLYLVEHRDRVVGKEELMRVAWPSTVVHENNLNQAISALRRALHDPRESPRFILTVSGRGYRFVAKVVEENTGANGLAATLTTAGHFEPPLASRGDRGGLNTTRSMAVLPFLPLLAGSGDPALELGMADALITRLSELQGIAVTPLSSVRAPAVAGADPLEIGRKLRVDAVLEGSVQIRDGRVRLSARLIDVITGKSMWAGHFDERLGNLFDLQDALARQIVDALQVELSATRLELLSRRPTHDVQAWQLYLQGRFQWGVRSEAALRRAITHFEGALTLDPEFALAATGLADAWAVLGVFNAVPPWQAFGQARAAAERAIEIDDTLAEAHAALGHVMVQGARDWSGGEQQYLHSLSLKPDNAQALMWLANVVCFQGRTGEALLEARRAQSLEPMSVIFAANVGMIEYFARDYDAAYARLAPLVEAVPQSTVAHRHLVRVQLGRGEAEAALALLDGRASETAPGSLSDLGRALALAGRHNAARCELRRLEALGEQGFGVGYDMALILAALGDYPQSLAALERAVHDGSQMVGFLGLEPGLDPLRQDDRFRAVARALGLA